MGGRKFILEMEPGREAEPDSSERQRPAEERPSEALEIEKLSPYDLVSRKKMVPWEEMCRIWARSMYRMNPYLLELCTVFNNKILIHLRTKSGWSFFYNGQELQEDPEHLGDASPKGKLTTMAAIDQFLQDLTLESMTIGTVPVYNIQRGLRTGGTVHTLFYIPNEALLREGKPVDTKKFGEMAPFLFKNPKAFLTYDFASDPVSCRDAPSFRLVEEPREEEEEKKTREKKSQVEITACVKAGNLEENAFRYSYVNGSATLNKIVFDFEEHPDKTVRNIVSFLENNKCSYLEQRIKKDGKQHGVLCARRVEEHTYFFISIERRTSEEIKKVVRALSNAVHGAWSR
jgi:hypothetical protein